MVISGGDLPSKTVVTAAAAEDSGGDEIDLSRDEARRERSAGGGCFFCKRLLPFSAIRSPSLRYTPESINPGSSSLARVSIFF